MMDNKKVNSKEQNSPKVKIVVESKVYAAKTESERRARELAEKQRNEEMARYVAHKRYARFHNPLPENPWQNFWAMVVIINFFYLLIGAGNGNVDYGNGHVKKWYNLARNAWNPLSNGFDVRHVPQDDGPILSYSKESVGKFDPKPVWYINMSLFLLLACITIGAHVRRQKLKKQYYQEQKIDTEAIDMMLNLQKFGKGYNLNTYQAQRLINLAPTVISHMAADERVYFDLLMRGDIEIENDDAFYGMAMAIIQGHLKEHPEDMKIVMDVFEPQSVPECLLKQYASYIR